MKSQLDRILNSDLNQYKLAVTQRIHTIDHLGECLSERSNFLSSFQQMLQKQLAASSKSKPKNKSQMQTMPLTQRKIDNKSKELSLNKQNCCNNDNPNHKINKAQKIVQDQEIMDKNNNKQILRKKLKSVLEYVYKFETDIVFLKLKLKQNLDELQSSISKYIKKSFIEIHQKMQTQYQQQIKILKLHNQQLQYQLMHNNKYQSQNNSEISNLSIISTSQYEPNHQFISCQKSEKQFPSLTPKYFQQVLNQCFTKKPMKIQNQNNYIWNHYKCQFTNSHVINQTKGGQNKSNQILKNPEMPSILKRHIQNQNYDFPDIRKLDIQNVSIKQGYGIFKIGEQQIYRGFWNDRKFNGQGKLAISNYKYDGNFQNGMFNGNGTLYLKNWMYRGEFKQNRVDGHGTLQIGQKKIIGYWQKNRFIKRY